MRTNIVIDDKFISAALKATSLSQSGWKETSA